MAHEVRFRFTQQEMARALWRSAYGRGTVLAGTAAMSALSIALMYAGGIWLLFGLMVGFFVMVSPISVWKQSLRFAGGHPAVQGEVALRFDDEGIAAPALEIAGTLPWRNLRLADEDGRYWFVQVLEPQAMIIIPKRAFDEARAAAFRARLPG
jgi:hypothetical protein